MSTIPEEEGATSYDRQAALYDRVIGNATYNRIVWGVSTARYTDFARRAVADLAGPLLDAGCGTLVFTAEAYRHAPRRLVLTDRSVGMLQRAAKRVDSPDLLLQADLFDLPFKPRSFATVASFGVLHCLEDLDGALTALDAQLAPGGRLFVSSLVAETPVGSRMLALLRRVGEVARPRSEEDFTSAIRRRFDDVTSERTGSMVFATARKAP